VVWVDFPSCTMCLTMFSLFNSTHVDVLLSLKYICCLCPAMFVKNLQHLWIGIPPASRALIPRGGHPPCFVPTDDRHLARTNYFAAVVT